MYNRCLLNRIRPIIDKILRPNQNGFRQSRSTTSHILALRRIVEELKNFDKELVVVFIDFRKAFDCINRSKMFKILEAYGVPKDIVNAIAVMYRDTSAVVITPDGETDMFSIDTGVLQGDPLAPFLFIICLDYALRCSISDTDGFTLRRRRSSRYPAEVLADIDFADDIALLENSLLFAQILLDKVEVACQAIGLYLNPSKTKYMHINPSSSQQLTTSDGSEIERVVDFKYLGGYTNSEKDMECRIAQAWSSLHSLQKIWKAPISKHTKTKVFKACTESILLYSCESWTMTAAQSKKLDGTYTKMLRKVYNVSWRDCLTNKQLYGPLPAISSVVRQRRLALAGHVVRGNEPAGRLMDWLPEGRRRVGRPYITLKTMIERDIGLSGSSLVSAMKDRSFWKSCASDCTSPV